MIGTPKSPIKQYQSRALETPRARFEALLKWSVPCLIAAFCLYRLSVFTPRPLDSPDTLRPHLYRLFSWFVGLYASREDAFAGWSTFSFLALLVPAALAALFYLSQHAVTKLPRRAARA